MNVRLSWGERFINWFPYNTKLYIKGEKGKSAAEVDFLYRELAKQFSDWMREQEEKDRIRAAEEEARRTFVNPLNRR